MALKSKKKSKTSSPIGEDASKVRFNTLVVNGDKYRTHFTENYKNRKKWEVPDLRKILSLIPGTVIKIYVKEGQEVKEGDLIMVLEAMKMKNKIYFPVDGTVKKIYVKEEQKVPKGFLMIELK